MKRSARFYSNARRDMLAGLVLLVAVMAIGCWVPVAILSASVSGGGSLVILAAGALWLSWRKFRAAIDSFRKASQADIADNLRAVRPRL